MLPNNAALRLHILIDGVADVPLAEEIKYRRARSAAKCAASAGHTSFSKTHRPDSRPAKRAAYREAEVRPREVQAPAAEY